MISKEYRLTERELGKVLSRRKPFFSYMFIANILDNKKGHGRVGILLSGKVTRGSVNRNFWRRRFYDMSLPYLGDIPPATPGLHALRGGLDIVLVPKKGTKLDHKNAEHLAEFEKNIQFLMKKIDEERMKRR